MLRRLRYARDPVEPRQAPGVESNSLTKSSF
jgi:hypothetical protein